MFRAAHIEIPEELGQQVVQHALAKLAETQFDAAIQQKKRREPDHIR